MSWPPAMARSAGQPVSQPRATGPVRHWVALADEIVAETLPVVEIGCHGRGSCGDRQPSDRRGPRLARREHEERWVLQYPALTGRHRRPVLAWAQGRG